MKKKHREHAADREHPRGVRARALTAGEQAQRRDRLAGSPLECDEAHQSDAPAVKMPMPRTKTVRRPTMSPARAPSSRSPPNVSA
jgi:hypothetical protein